MVSRSRSVGAASESGKRLGLRGPPFTRGFVEPEFKAVERQFLKIIQREPKGGEALCIYHQGRCVVDLQGGVRNGASEPWAPETLVLSYSTGKGVLATLLHILVDQGAGMWVLLSVHGIRRIKKLASWLVNYIANHQSASHLVRRKLASIQ